MTRRQSKLSGAAMFISACKLYTVLFSSLLVLCLLSILVTNKQFQNSGIIKEGGCQASSTRPCAERAETPDSNNSSTELHVNHQPSDTRKIQAAAVDAEPDTIVLIWRRPYSMNIPLNCDIFNITGCHLTFNRSLLHKANGVLIHHYEIQLHDMPKEPRPHFQKWVWFNVEPPSRIPQYPKLNDIFNLTCNYRPDSHIPVTYGFLEPVTSEDKSFTLPAKDKLVCWIVSNWSKNLKRVLFYNELKKHIKVDTYGGAFGQRISVKRYTEIVSSCKFYLSFENSVAKDYITEKLHKPMMLGTVPIVLGLPRQNYDNRVPPDSFIHVDDFSTPKELAERLLYLDQNQAEYMRYFGWRSMFKARIAKFGTEHACRTCQYLQNHKEYQVVRNLNEWFWG